MTEIEQYFKILGVSPGSSLGEIKQAHRDLVQVWHPDRFPNNSRLQQKAQDKLKEINYAYSALLRSRLNPKDTCHEDPDPCTKKQVSKATFRFRKHGAIAIGIVLFASALMFVSSVLYSVRSDLAEIPYNLAMTHFQSNHFREAERMYKLSLSINPGSAKAHFRLGEVFYKLKRYSEAKDAFISAIAIDPSNDKAYSGLALSYKKLGPSHKPLDDCSQVPLTDLNCSEFYYALGIGYEENGLLKEARESYGRAIQLDAEYMAAHCSLDLINARIGEH